ncbi:MAG: zf-HC2 domain-containing protein [Acidobacteria bacterium]|nr:zf-HC2 domain-containing protein [Acidobacteriota bacterium]
MTCREFTSFIVDYLAGELEPACSEPFERHLSRCQNCLEYLSQYRAAVRLGRAVFSEPDATLPDDVPEDLVRAILAARDR